MRETRGTALAVALTFLVGVALVATARLTSANVRRLIGADASVRHTHAVLETVHSLLLSLQDAETSERGYIIAGDPRYLEPYADGRTVALGHLDRLGELARDDPAQRERVEQMRPLVSRKLDVLDHAIALRKAGGFEAARAVVLSGDGRRVMDVLRERVAEMEAAEAQLLAERTRASAAAARTALLTNALAALGSLGLLAAAFGVWRRRTRERDQAAALLRAEKEKFRTTLTSIGDGVVVTDAAGHVLMMNETARSILGWDDDALGRPLEDVFRIVNEHTREAVESPVRKVLREGRIAGLANHTVLVRRDGSETPIDDSGAPVRDERGAIVGVVLVFRDVRERREAERELQRRAELLEEQDRRKDQFLALLSHELRNPLASIHNAVAVLSRAHPASDETRRARAVIGRQAAQLARLVEDLLDVSRIAQGKVRLQKAHVDLADVVRRALDDHRGLFASKGVRLECAGLEQLWVDADAARLTQVAGNLLQNAAKFTSEGGRVSVELQEEDGKALLRVRDDGIGIEGETLTHLFRPFVQGETTLHRTQGGLGLGLALTKSIVELHGGSVRASSEGPGRGAEFVVALPVVRNVALRPVAAAASRWQPSLRICVVDDDEDAAETLADLLRLDGHEVHVATDGLHAIDLVLAVHPDVVLCDVGLPRLDGFEVARRLRDAGSPAVLVALTGYAAPEDVQRAEDAGFRYHVAKPPDAGRLRAILASLAPATGGLAAGAHPH